MSDAIAVIPARGGSRRIPGKNVREFHGLPIIAYSIMKARESGLFSYIVVSSDDAHILEVGLSYGAYPLGRSRDLSDDKIGTQTVMAEVLKRIQHCGLFEGCPDYTCCIYATAPLMSVDDLKMGYRLLKEDMGLTDYVFSVGYPPLHDAAQFYWARTATFMMNAPLVSHRSRIIKVDENRDCDINVEEDWKRAEEMYELLQS